MKYTRECALPSCNKKFETNREWQRFCCRSHQEEYWKEDRYSKNKIKEDLFRTLKDELNKQQDERMGEIEKKLGIDK